MASKSNSQRKNTSSDRKSCRFEHTINFPSKTLYDGIFQVLFQLEKETTDDTLMKLLE